MKTIFINGRFLTQHITGVQRYAHEILAAIDSILDGRNDLQVFLVSPKNIERAPLLRNIIHREIGSFQGHLWEQIDLPRFVKNEILFCPGNTAPILSLLISDKVFVTVHDLSYLYFPKAYSIAFRLLYKTLIPIIMRCAKSIITVSKSEMSSIIKHYPHSESRLFAIQNGGLPFGVSPNIKNIIPTNQYVLYVGSLSKRKNFLNMFSAAKHLAESRGINFIFIGGVPDGLVDSVSEVPDRIRDKIQFLGQINDWTTLMRYYLAADCFLFPSFYEASPLPPIEAMACGCPVISSDIPSLRERCEMAALYCDPFNVEDIVQKVEMLLDDPSLQEDLRQKGFKQAEKYSWRNCALQTLNLM